MCSRYLDEKSLVGNRRTGEMEVEEEEEVENISRIFGGGIQVGFGEERFRNF